MMSTINRIVYSIIIVIGFAGIVYLYWNNANNCKKLKIENLDLLNQNSTLKHKYENSKEVIENSCNFDGLCLPNVHSHIF